MHEFTELVAQGTHYVLNALMEAEEKVSAEFETSARTPSVKAVQMIQMEKVVLAVGTFSIYEAELQNKLQCENGFGEAGKILKEEGEIELAERFEDYRLAINVLKLGQGRSYDALLKKSSKLPFRMKRKEEHFFNEGDVSEVETLILVDDDFVQNCADLVGEVGQVLRRAQPHASQDRRSQHSTPGESKPP